MVSGLSAVRGVSTPGNAANPFAWAVRTKSLPTASSMECALIALLKRESLQNENKRRQDKVLEPVDDAAEATLRDLACTRLV